MTKCESRVCYWQKGGLCRAPHQDTYDTGNGDKELSKHSKLVEEMKAWVDSQYEDGRTTALSQNELESKAEELSGGILKKKG